MDTLCDVGKALSSPVRVEILKLLYSDNMIIGEIAKALGIPLVQCCFSSEASGKGRFDPYGGTARKQRNHEGMQQKI